MLIRFFALVLFMMSNLLLYASPLQFNGRVYDDETVASLVTVITSTSPIPSIPNTEHIYHAQKSLSLIPVLQKCKKIIVFDAIRPGKEHLANRYEEYKENILNLTKNDPYFANTQLIFCSKWGHLSGAIQEAIKHVTTPYIFVHQHDLLLKKEFDLNRAIATLDANPTIKYIHFSTTVNTDPSWNGPVDDVVKGPHFIPLSRSFGWSDRTHVASVNYYKKIVLPRCHECFMEDRMRALMIASLNKYGKAFHPYFGAYLYGDLLDGDYIEHTDGRNN